MEADRLANALALGRVLAPPANLKPANLKPAGIDPVWSLDTASGRWVVKTRQPPGQFWHDTVRQSATLESAAFAAGIDMPEPLVPSGESSGLWVPLDDGGRYVRAARHVEGVHPDVPLDPATATWAGATMAALERLQLAADATVDAGYTTHTSEEWRGWLDEAMTLGILNGDQAHVLAAVAADLNAVISSGLADNPAMLVLHRDFSSVNIMLTQERPMLLDFDHAGPQVPWWEVVGHAFGLASADLGVVPPDRATVRAVMDGYGSAGGRQGDADATAFTGMLAARLSYTAWRLWTALGHRGGEPAHRVAAAADVRDATTVLPGIVANVENWSAWLG